MFQKIMTPTDGSELAAEALEQRARFAEEIGGKITAVTVTEPVHMLSARRCTLSPGDRGLLVTVKCQNREEFVVEWTDPESRHPWLGALEQLIFLYRLVRSERRA